MKNLILSLVMLVSSFVSFSQVIEVEFDEYIGFNSGSLGKYDEVIDSTNYVRTFDHSGGTNRYVIDLTKKTMSRYFDGTLSKSTSILSYKKEGSLIHMTINDEENLTGNNIISNVVVNTDINDDSHPKFILYFLSTHTNTFNGFVTMK